MWHTLSPMCWNRWTTPIPTQDGTQFIVCRLFVGFGASASLTISGGINSDLWTAEERGKVMAVATLAPLLGPALGPIAGGYITEYTTWRWDL